MAENIGPIRDSSISLKATEKLKSFFKKHKEEIRSFKQKPPKNILKLDSDDEIMLTVEDVEWLDSFLKHKRNVLFGEFEPLTGRELDKEICKMFESKQNFANYAGNVKCSNLYLHELLDSSSLILPKNEVIKRNPELARRIEKLKKEQAEREYKAMTRNIDSTRKFVKEDTLAYQMNMMNRHLIAVGQFVLSVGAGFAFGFLGVELIVGEQEFGFRLLLGITCALIIALAEFYFLAKHLNEEEAIHSGANQEAFHLNTSRVGKSHND